MNWAYIRVSTGDQTVENQKLEIKHYAKLHRLTKIKYIAETVSGTKNYEKRKLGQLMAEIQTGDILIVTELSRLGRSLSMIFEILNTLLKRGVQVYAIKENYELGDNIQSQVLAFAFGLSAQIERDLISERTKMGLERARKEGKQIGSIKGVKHKNYKLDKKIRFIRKRIREHQSINSLAKDLQVTNITLVNFCKRNNIQYKRTATQQEAKDKTID